MQDPLEPFDDSSKPNELQRREAQNQAARWNDKVQEYLRSQKETSRSTMRYALASFFRHCEKFPDEVRPGDVLAWKNFMVEDKELKNSTVRQWLGHLSSFYKFLMRVTHPQDEPLVEVNPASPDFIDRTNLPVTPYSESNKLTPQQGREMIAVLDPSVEGEARDRALMLAGALCGWRGGTTLKLTAEDLYQQNGAWMARIVRKGGRKDRFQLPPPVIKAIRHYLERAGRALETLEPEAPIFVSASDNAGHQGRATQLEGSKRAAVRASSVNRKLKEYAKRAGVDASVSLHSFRHLSADLFYEACGGDLRDTRDFLAHQNAETTDRYLRRSRGQQNVHWEEMMDELFVDGERP